MCCDTQISRARVLTPSRVQNVSPGARCRWWQPSQRRSDQPSRPWTRHCASLARTEPAGRAQHCARLQHCTIAYLKHRFVEHERAAGWSCKLGARRRRRHKHGVVIPNPNRNAKASKHPNIPPETSRCLTGCNTPNANQARCRGDVS